MVPFLFLKMDHRQQPHRTCTTRLNKVSRCHRDSLFHQILIISYFFAIFLLCVPKSTDAVQQNNNRPHVRGTHTHSSLSSSSALHPMTSSTTDHKNRPTHGIFSYDNEDSSLEGSGDSDNRNHNNNNNHRIEDDTEDDDEDDDDDSDDFYDGDDIEGSGDSGSHSHEVLPSPGSSSTSTTTSTTTTSTPSSTTSTTTSSTTTTPAPSSSSSTTPKSYFKLEGSGDEDDEDYDDEDDDDEDDSDEPLEGSGDGGPASHFDHLPPPHVKPALSSTSTTTSTTSTTTTPAPTSARTRSTTTSSTTTTTTSTTPIPTLMTTSPHATKKPGRTKKPTPHHKLPTERRKPQQNINHPDSSGPDTFSPPDIPNVIIHPPHIESSTRFPVLTSSSAPDDSNTHDNEISIILGRRDRMSKSQIFLQPGVLAAMIGGAVVGLLCAILLVMFIVYRMRKKDEGSYTMDEPKRITASYSRGGGYS